MPLIPGYNRSMYLYGRLILVVAVLSVAAFATDEPQGVLTLPCAQAASSNPGCNPSKADLKKARGAFSRGLRLEKTKRIDEAYQEFDSAARLVPRNIDYLTALAVTRQELVSDHLTKGNADLEKGKQVEAQAEFRSALNLDPENRFAEQRLQDSLREWAPKRNLNFQVVQDAGEVVVVPAPDRHTFHFRGDSHTLLTQVAAAFGVTASLEDSVVSRRVHFDIENVDFYTAMRAACQVTGTLWTPLAEKLLLVAKDSPENHRLFDRMAMRTFSLGTTTPQDVTDVVSLLRTIFQIRFIQQQGQAGLIEVRAPIHVLDAAAKFLELFSRARPQVMLDIEVYQIDHSLTRDMGLHIPYNFNLFNIPAAALVAAGGQNIQNLINQLIASGGINQANSQAISALLAQLQGQQNSIFSQPLATFGGGLTLMGLSLDTLGAQLSLNESWVKLLQRATLRAAQGNDATFRIGQRYPILNASFAPIFNTSAISQVLQNGSFVAPIPSFSYEDLGLDIKAKPVVSSNYDVSLQLEMQLRTLAGQSVNGVPIIANRQYKGSINLENGEPAVVASSFTRNELRSMTGLPGLGSIPGFNKVVTTNNKTDEEDELLIVITPHVVNLESNENAEVWLPQ